MFYPAVTKAPTIASSRAHLRALKVIAADSWTPKLRLLLLHLLRGTAPPTTPIPNTKHWSPRESSIFCSEATVAVTLLAALTKQLQPRPCFKLGIRWQLAPAWPTTSRACGSVKLSAVAVERLRRLASREKVRQSRPMSILLRPRSNSKIVTSWCDTLRHSMVLKTETRNTRHGSKDSNAWEMQLTEHRSASAAYVRQKATIRKQEATWY